MFDWEINLLSYRRMPLPHFPFSQLLVCNLYLQMFRQCSPFLYMWLEDLFFLKDCSNCLLGWFEHVFLVLVFIIFVEHWSISKVAIFSNNSGKVMFDSKSSFSSHPFFFKSTNSSKSMVYFHIEISFLLPGIAYRYRYQDVLVYPWDCSEVANTLKNL